MIIGLLHALHFLCCKLFKFLYRTLIKYCVLTLCQFVFKPKRVGKFVKQQIESVIGPVQPFRDSSPGKNNGLESWIHFTFVMFVGDHGFIRVRINDDPFEERQTLFGQEQNNLGGSAANDSLHRSCQIHAAWHPLKIEVVISYKPEKFQFVLRREIGVKTVLPVQEAVENWPMPQAKTNFLVDAAKKFIERMQGAAFQNIGGLRKAKI